MIEVKKARVDATEALLIRTSGLLAQAAIRVEGQYENTFGTKPHLGDVHDIVRLGLQFNLYEVARNVQAEILGEKTWTEILPVGGRQEQFDACAYELGHHLTKFHLQRNLVRQGFSGGMLKRQ